MTSKDKGDVDVLCVFDPLRPRSPGCAFNSGLIGDSIRAARGGSVSPPSSPESDPGRPLIRFHRSSENEGETRCDADDIIRPGMMNDELPLRLLDTNWGFKY